MAQPSVPAPPPPGTPHPQGSFTPFTRSRTDIPNVYATSSRSIAGPDYRLGPGDVLDVQIAGRLDVTRVQVVVDPEGTLNIPPLGTAAVAGSTLLEATGAVEGRVKRAEEEGVIAPGAESAVLLPLFTQVRGDIEKARQQRIELEQAQGRLQRSDASSVTERVYIDTTNPAIQTLLATQTELMLERNNLGSR